MRILLFLFSYSNVTVKRLKWGGGGFGGLRTPLISKIYGFLWVHMYSKRRKNFIFLGFILGPNLMNWRGY